MKSSTPDESHAFGLDRRAALKGAGMLVAGALPFGSAAAAQVGLPVTAGTPPAALATDARTLTSIMAEYAVSTSFDKLPGEVRERAKKVIFDEIASSYFGQRSEGGRLAAEYVKRFGYGPREARIHGTNQRAPAHYAALANGTAGHGEEVDGTHVAGGHPGASIVHASTAMTELHKKSGRDLINAVVLGYDVGVRLVEACGGAFAVRDKYHIHSDLLYGLGCAAASCRLLGLDADRHRHALALTTFQSNSLAAIFAERTHISKSFCNGQYAFGGISAAWMAQTGLQGHDDIIGGESGILAAWGSQEHRHLLTRNLGADFRIMGANFKFYNAGQPIHTPVEAALRLMRQFNLSVDSIQSVVIGMPARPLKTVDNREMQNISVQSMVTASLVSGGYKIIDQPFPAMLDNPVYKRLRPLVSAQVDPEIDREFPNGRGARVTITTKAGAVHSLRIDSPRGHSQRGEPSWDDLAEKWRGSLPGCDVDKALSVGQRLETLQDARVLFAAFAGVNTARAANH